MIKLMNLCQPVGVNSLIKAVCQKIVKPTDATMTILSSMETNIVGRLVINFTSSTAVVIVNQKILGTKRPPRAEITREVAWQTIN